MMVLIMEVVSMESCPATEAGCASEAGPNTSDVHAHVSATTAMVSERDHASARLRYSKMSGGGHRTCGKER